ncbi:hypothetical protein X975_18363, partial [Stegodyphus mimosarum]
MCSATMTTHVTAINRGKATALKSMIKTLLSDVNQTHRSSNTVQTHHSKTTPSLQEKEQILQSMPSGSNS